MANGIGSFVRALGALAPVAAGGVQGFVQGREIKRQREIQDEQRQQAVQRMALEEALLRAQTTSAQAQAEERRARAQSLLQPEVPEGPTVTFAPRPGVSIRGAPGQIAGAAETVSGLPATQQEPEEPTPVNLQRMTDAEGNVLSFNPQTGATAPVLGPGGEPVRAPTTQSRVPVAVQRMIIDNKGRASVIDNALTLLDEHPKSVGGLESFLPDRIQQFSDPEGIELRAAIADIGSLIIHDRSGAAVTISEAPRLKPFIPAITDSPEAVRTKLTRLKGLIDEETRLLQEGIQGGQGATQEDELLRRAAELRGLGLTEDEIIERMRQEGIL